jgi:DNA modification methylase
MYGTRGKPYLNKKYRNFTEIMNNDIGNGNQTLEDISSILDLWTVKRVSTSEYLHATQKPLDLHNKPIKRCSKIGDNILDLFGGSGSTLIACEKLGRKSFLVEKDPVFCDVIRNRFAKYNK